MISFFKEIDLVITGASGFIGKMLTEKLKQQQSCTFIKVNLLNENEIIDFFNLYKPTYMIHLAWASSQTDYLHSDVNDLWLKYSIKINNNFTKNGGKYSIYAGSCLEYSYKDKILNESDESVQSKLAKQATDLALLSQGLLKGKDLSEFISRSVEMI